MQKNNPFFDDLARIATSAGTTMLEWRKEIERMVQEQIEKLVGRMQMVTREEFEVLREVAQQARKENAVLKKRLDALEQQLKAEKPVKKPAAAKVAAKPKTTE